jgi:hypothetical protein
VRSHPPELGGTARHAYAFQARDGGGGPFRDVISGAFDGGSSARGRGNVVLDFQALWDLGMNDEGTPHGTLQIAYDRATEPTTIDLQLTSDGFGVVQFDYGFAGYRDGSGAFDYRFRDRRGDVLTVATGFDAGGAGRAAVAYTAAGGGTGRFDQCWDGAACLTYVDDPSNFTCPPVSAPCSFGTVGACPAVPVSPF